MMMKKFKIQYLQLFVLLLFSVPVFAQSITENEQEILKDLNYKDSITFNTIDGVTLKLILFYPKNVKYKKAPLMVFTHGGGWTSGNRYVVLKNIFLNPLKELLANGIACASVEYRLNTDKIKVVDAVADCKDAVKFLVTNAKNFGLDDEKIGIWGGSAGGHLSLMAGLADDHLFPGAQELVNIHPKIKCIVSYFPQTTFTNKEIVNATTYLPNVKLNKMMGNDPKTAELLSPVNYINKSNCPILLIHGDNDKTLSYQNSVYFLSKSKEIGNDVTLIQVKKAGHGLSGKNISPTMEEVSKQAAEFMIKNLFSK